MRIAEEKVIARRRVGVPRSSELFPVVVQRVEGCGPCAYCLQFAGAGRYFKSWPEVQRYALERFGAVIE